MLSPLPLSHLSHYLLSSPSPSLFQLPLPSPSDSILHLSFSLSLSSLPYSLSHLFLPMPIPSLFSDFQRPAALFSMFYLEKMKNENLSPLLDQNGHQTCMVYEEQFQREASQLNMANEQLGRIFPQFNEFLESGNALERVLALEIELAEALKSKKKDAVHFQSSFLKQHHDEEAICKSFRDINELIKDMLELKKKNATVEIELKEMHNRYSQLSVQFAEVEGERQKLVMTLKSIRTTRKAESFNPW